MRAVILAGGKGTRLIPYTTVLPKPLMPVCEHPILEVVVRQLARHGFEHITLAVGHLAELIQAFFGDGARFNVRLDYFREEEPLGTAGALGLIPNLTDTFLTMNGDLLTTLDYRALIAAHRQSGAAATVATYPRRVEIDFGVIEDDNQGLLADYREKPVYHFRVSMGVNVFEPQVHAFIEPGKRLDIPDLLLRLQRAGEKVACYRADDCQWLDIGRMDDYQAAQAAFEQNPALYLGE